MRKQIGLYIHIPFCRQKCFYCDFPSFAGREAEQGAYLEALLAEIAQRGAVLGGREVCSIFLGGGTPTTLPIPLLERLMAAIFTHFQVAADAEITIEANPGTLDEKMAHALRRMGCNRLSMGVQAWQDRLLKRLGRIHTIAEFRENYRIVREAGFENINVDLMFALPEQSMADWQQTLWEMTELEPAHISAYSLILEEGTPFYAQYAQGLLVPADEELDREMYHWAVDFLAERGYQQYEISNFAKPGRQSRHNRTYWQAEEYLGLGLSAHSYLDGVRFHNPCDMAVYLAAAGNPAQLTQDAEKISMTDAMAECMFLGLRLTEGVSFARFRACFGQEMQEIYGAQIAQLKRDGLLLADAEGVRLTGRGIDLSNYVFEKFLL